MALLGLQSNQVLSEVNLTVETDVIRMAFKRVPKGLFVNVRTSPEIEEYMKGLGDGLEILDVGEYGRQWSPFLSDTELKVYGLPTEDGLMGWIRNGNSSYRIDRVGQRLFEGGDMDSRLGVNLSFLRLVGTSAPEGVTFTVHGVFSSGVVKEFEKTFADAADGFYQNFLKPVNVQIVLSTTAGNA